MKEDLKESLQEVLSLQEGLKGAFFGEFQGGFSLWGGVPALHSVVAARLVSRHRLEFWYFEGLSILRAGGRRVRNLRGSKVLANWARAASEAVLLCAEDWRAILEVRRRAPELFGCTPSCSGAASGGGHSGRNFRCEVAKFFGELS